MIDQYFSAFAIASVLLVYIHLNLPIFFRLDSLQSNKNLMLDILRNFLDPSKLTNFKPLTENFDNQFWINLRYSIFTLLIKIFNNFLAYSKIFDTFDNEFGRISINHEDQQMGLFTTHLL